MRTDTDIDFKKYNNTNLGVKKKKAALDSALNPEAGNNLGLLTLCNGYYNSLNDFRQRRERNRNYYRGKQWGDKVEDPENAGEYITEEELIVRQGKVPLKNNQIRNLVRNMIGQYRSNKTKPVIIARDREKASLSEMMTNALQAAQQINEVKELDVRNYEEFLLSGGAAGKIGFQYWRDRNIEDLKYTNVNMNRIFFNTDIEDPRMTDLNLIGEILDIDMDDLIGAFSRTEEEEQQIRNWYSHTNSDYVTTTKGLSSQKIDSLSFISDMNPHKCRVIEVWQLRGEWRLQIHDYLDASYEMLGGTKAELRETKKNITELNQMRIQKAAESGVPEDEVPLIDYQDKFERFWYVKYLTPYGHTLYEGETPYEHREHPFVMALYPMVDGEVWGFVEDIIDQQKYINRMIIMIDFIMGASAKGVLLVPEDAIPDDMTEDDFASEWSKFNGVIKFKAKPGVALPQQISANSSNIGVHEMLSLQMRMLQEISGVSGAIQGHTAKSGTPSSLYAQEAQNASISTMDIMETFNSFRARRDRKMIKVIQQFYQEKRYLLVSGRSYSEEAKMYDPDAVRNIDFEYSLAQSTDTPVYRQLIDESLMTLLQNQHIDIQMYLENSSIPFADKLLEQIKQRQEMAVKGQMPEGMTPEMMKEMGGQADPKAMQMAMQAMGLEQKAAA